MASPSVPDSYSRREVSPPSITYITNYMETLRTCTDTVRSTDLNSNVKPSLLTKNE